MIAVRFELTKLTQQNLSLPPLTARAHNPTTFGKSCSKTLLIYFWEKYNKTLLLLIGGFCSTFLTKLKKVEILMRGLEPLTTRLKVARSTS